MTADDVSFFLRDASAFVTSFDEAIKVSAAHIYLSALPFASPNSLVRQCFSPLFTGLPSIETSGVDDFGGRCVLVLGEHDQIVTKVVYSPNGKVLASSSDNYVRLWDTCSGVEICKPLECAGEQIGSITFTPDSQSLVAGTSVGSLFRWDVPTGHPLLPHCHQHTNNIREVAVSPDGKTIAFVFGNWSMCLWRSDTDQSTCNLQGDGSLVCVVSFSPDDTTLASGETNGTVRLWDYRLRRLIGEPLRGHRGVIHKVAFSPDGVLLAVASYDRAVRVWDVKSRHQLRNYCGHQGWVKSVALALGGRVLASSSADCAIRVWNLCDDGYTTSPLILRGHNDVVSAVCISNDGLHIASCSSDSTVRLWDIGGNYSSVLPLEGHTNWVNAVTVSTEGRLVASASRDGSVRVWDAHTCEQICTPLLGHTGPVRSVAFSHDGQWIVTGSDDTTLRLWDAQTGQLAQSELRGHGGPVNSVAFSPESLHIASGSSDCTIRIWNIGIEKPTSTQQIKSNHSVFCVCYSGDGRVIAAGDDFGYIRIFDVVTGHQVQSFRNSNAGRIESLSFSPDGARIVSGAAAKIIGFDVSTGNLVFDARGHAGCVNTVAYSPDGQIIASGALDRTVRLWDAKTAEAVEPVLHGHSGAVISVVFSPDGRTLVTSGSDMTIRLWDMEKAKSLAAQRKQNALALLAFAQYRDGWLVSQTGELLLWVPPEYRGRLEIGGHSRIIATRRAIVTVKDGALHHGEQWTQCWSPNNLNSSSW